MKYIKIGEKENGRYHKSEELSIDQFYRLMLENTTKFERPNKTIWSVISGKHKKEMDRIITYQVAQEQLIEDIIAHILKIINIDKKGKKLKL